VSTKTWTVAIPLALLISMTARAESASTTATTATTETSDKVTDKVTDAQIASVMKTANDAEISAAKLATKQAQNNEVKGFAKQMIKEHSKNEKDGKDISKKAGIKMEDTEMSKTLKQDADKKTADLKSLKGAEFDRAYMASQIDMHEQLLAQLNDKFIPNAQNEQMKSFLEQTKTHVQQHLDHAKKIQTALGATQQ
jgi:putative membrane protein